MKSQLTFIPEVLTCCTLDNYCDYYSLTLLVIYEHLNILAMFCYNLHPTQPEEARVGQMLITSSLTVLQLWN